MDCERGMARPEAQAAHRSRNWGLAAKLRDIRKKRINMLRRGDMHLDTSTISPVGI